MSDWIEELITKIESENSLTYLELFSFNNFNPPKFWFEEKVKVLSDRTGVILGLEWRDGIKILPRGGSQNAGWWYKICLDGRQSLMGFHEDSLEISDVTWSGRSPP
jgi:hypothetical protein